MIHVHLVTLNPVLGPFLLLGNVPRIRSSRPHQLSLLSPPHLGKVCVGKWRRRCRTIDRVTGVFPLFLAPARMDTVFCPCHRYQSLLSSSSQTEGQET